jgi:hypothetical protein
MQPQKGYAADAACKNGSMSVALSDFFIYQQRAEEVRSHTDRL